MARNQEFDLRKYISQKFRFLLLENSIVELSIGNAVSKEIVAIDSQLLIN